MAVAKYLRKQQCPQGLDFIIVCYETRTVVRISAHANKHIYVNIWHMINYDATSPVVSISAVLYTSAAVVSLCLLFVCNEMSVCFVCSRNNGYAISTPTREQYRGDGIGIYLFILN